jgi:putative intracellular protease/amidase
MSKTILIIVTSARETTWGKDTGYWLEELAAPYNHLTSLGYDVEIASIKGGEPPLDATSVESTYLSEDTEKFKADPVAQAKLAASKPIGDFIERAKAGAFRAGFLPGGHGAAIDFPKSAELKEVLENIYAHNGVVSAVCHGPCGLVHINDLVTGEPLVKGKKVTGFSDVEETAVSV